jgi:hypothetical protein
MKENIQRALAAELQDLSAEFRQSQESYLQDLTARKDRYASSFSFLSSDAFSSNSTQRKLGTSTGLVQTGQTTQIHIWTDHRPTDPATDRESDGQIDRQTQADRQTDRWTDTQTDRHTDRQAVTDR